MDAATSEIHGLSEGIFLKHHIFSNFVNILGIHILFWFECLKVHILFAVEIKWWLKHIFSIPISYLFLFLFHIFLFLIFSDLNAGKFIYCLLSRSNGGWGGNNGKLLGWWGEGGFPPQPWGARLHLPSALATFSFLHLPSYQLHLASSLATFSLLVEGPPTWLHLQTAATFTLLPSYIYPPLWLHLANTFTPELPLHFLYIGSTF